MPNKTQQSTTGQNSALQYITIQEPKPDKFKITIGKEQGLVWTCHPQKDVAVEQLKKTFLKSIKKSPNSYLTQEHIDDFLKFVGENGFRIKMPLVEWKKNFARRFQRHLERKGVTLEQIENQGFTSPAAKRWLRNLHKNGIYQARGAASAYIVDLCRVLGVDGLDEL